MQLNYRFELFPDDESLFWDYVKIYSYDTSEYKTKIKRKFYEKDITLDLNKKVEELKKMVFEQTEIPMNRQSFTLDNIELSDDKVLKRYDLVTNRLSIGISKVKDFTIKIKYPNSEPKEIFTDIYNTGLEFLEEIQNKSLKYSSDIKYNLMYQNKNINIDEKFIDIGIKSGDLIELNNRSTYPICIKTLTGKNMTVYVEPFDTVEFLKSLVHCFEEIPIDQQRLIYTGRQLVDSKILADYKIENGSILQMILRLRGGKY